MTGLERKSAFVPVPPSATNYTSGMSFSPDSFKVHQEGSPDYPSMSYFNQLPQSIPSLSIHSYNRSHMQQIHQDTELISPFQQLNNPSSHIETFHPTLPTTQHNKVLVKVSDSTLVMADVKCNKNNSGAKIRNKRKQDVLSSESLNRKSMRLPHHSDKSETPKKRKIKPTNSSTQGSQNNNNTDIRIKVDSDDDWGDLGDEETSIGSKTSPNSSFSPAKVRP